ncbi:hypothetical protein [Leptospira wolffii]|uniref:hypothetical protein n=1 Tax=Leptospira wolffii TaxID=409998 RepID=UPI00058C2587|nr:hypothetical protein [Leptospira wolffii]
MKIYALMFILPCVLSCSMNASHDQQVIATRSIITSERSPFGISKIDYTEFLNDKRLKLIELKLIQIEVPESVFDEYESDLELVLYSSYLTVRRTGESGPLVSSVDPQLAPYFLIRRAFRFSGVGSNLFQKPIVSNDPKLVINFHLVDINGISQGDQEKVKAIYEKFTNTAQLAVDQKLIKSATTISALSYVPALWSIWEALVSIVNLIDENENFTVSPFSLTLNGNLGYRPYSGDIDPLSLKRKAFFHNDAREYEIDQYEKVERTKGEIESISYSFSTQPIGIYRIKLHLSVTCSLL